MYRLIDNELVNLPNILDINKKGAFKDLDPEDELVILAIKIDWKSLEQSFIQFYSKNIVRPCKMVRLMIGLVLLKYLYQLSDQRVI